MAFKSEIFRQIDLTDLDIPHGLFADEDIWLSTQNQGFINILSPKIHYIHDLPAPSVTRGHTNNQKIKIKCQKYLRIMGFCTFKTRESYLQRKKDHIKKIENIYQTNLLGRDLYS